MKSKLIDCVNEFDYIHIVKQIILIGVDGAVKNIEFDITEEKND